MTCSLSACITSILVAVLTGVVTSEGIGKRCGDAMFEGCGRRLLQLFTPHAEAERLGFKTEVEKLKS